MDSHNRLNFSQSEIRSADPSVDIKNRTISIFPGKVPVYNVLLELQKMTKTNNPFAVVQERADRSVFVTYHNQKDADFVLEKQLVSLKDGEKIRIMNYSEQIKTVTVGYLPLWVTDERLCEKLSNYGHVLSIRYSRSKYTFGKRRPLGGNRIIKMIMNVPIPKFLKIDNYVALIIYDGVKMACWKCHSSGHHISQCTAKKCLNCFSFEHCEMECPDPCHKCGSSKHEICGCALRKGESPDLSSDEISECSDPEQDSRILTNLQRDKNCNAFKEVTVLGMEPGNSRSKPQGLCALQMSSTLPRNNFDSLVSESDEEVLKRFEEFKRLSLFRNNFDALTLDNKDKMNAINEFCKFYRNDTKTKFEHKRTGEIILRALGNLYDQENNIFLPGTEELMSNIVESPNEWNFLHFYFEMYLKRRNSEIVRKRKALNG